MNPTTSGIAERLIYSAVLAVAMKLVAAGYITSDMATYLAAGAVALAGSVWAWWINRPKALLVAAAANAPAGTTIVTSEEIANSTPLSTNIVSNTEQKVVTK